MHIKNDCQLVEISIKLVRYIIKRRVCLFGFPSGFAAVTLAENYDLQLLSGMYLKDKGERP